jgi:membrane fusion protein, multidrug efflux system
MRHKSTFVTVRSTGIVAIALLMLIFSEGCKNRFDKDEEEARQAQAKKAPAQIATENGQTVLMLDSPTQNRLGLEIATLAAIVTRAQATLPAVVIPVQDLAAFRNNYITAQAQLQKARVEGDVARKEYARLRTLFDQNQNISEKSLQSAEATLRSNEADVRAGEQQLTLQESVARQEWGSVAAKWVVEGSPELQRILDQTEVLVQMTMSAGTSYEAPKVISVETPSDHRTQANLISTFPRVDPRIQGRSFLYLTHFQPSLTPGVTLLAHLSMGSPMKGLIVPISAVVWSEGKAWVYQQTASDRFTRRAIPTDIGVEQGFFVADGFSPGDKLVTKGAQALLSEELLLHGQSGGDTDVD